MRRGLPDWLRRRLVVVASAAVGIAVGFGWASIKTIGPIPPSSTLKQYGTAKLKDVRAKDGEAIAELDTRRATELMADADWEYYQGLVKVIAKLDFPNGPTVNVDLGRRAFSIDGVPGIYRVAEHNRLEYERWVEKEVQPRLRAKDAK